MRVGIIVRQGYMSNSIQRKGIGSHGSVAEAEKKNQRLLPSHGGEKGLHVTEARIPSLE